MNDSSTRPKRDHRVALVQCEDYQAAPQALSRGIELLGGLNQFCSPGEYILLKPNLLLGDKPERGSTTNPLFFKAAAEFLQAGGIKLMYGDSPGFGSPEGAVRSSGIEAIASALGIELADFVEGRDLPTPDGILMKQFNLAMGLAQVDGIFNLPKFKTHALTRMTGAVKNLFGCLPGVQKAGFHARLSDEIHFGEMLVDLAELISPRLHIMDGIVGMEGNGPRSGHLRQVGVILLSANPHALDDCVARMMDLDTELVPTLKAAQEYGYYQPDAIEILGDPIEAFIMKDFDVNRSRQSTTGSQVFYMDIFKQWVTPRPIIDADFCSRCGRCVSVCPASPKAIRFLNGRKAPPKYDYHDCIRCYCCQEMCPDEAISIETPIVGRILNQIHL